MIIVIELLN